MRPVVASELLDLGAYEAVRDRFVDRMVRDKRARRVRDGHLPRLGVRAAVQEGG